MDKKCSNCWGNGICKLHETAIVFEGHVPTIIEDEFAAICPSYYVKGSEDYG